MNELKTVWLHQPERGGEGIMLFVDRSGIAGAFYFPGRWYFLGDFTGNATGAIDFRIGRQDELNKPPRPVGAGTLRLNADGSAEITWNIDGLLNSGVFEVLMEPPAGIYPPPFPPPPYPVEPAVPIEPIEPSQPVLPPGVVGRLHVIPSSWALLFGGEFGQTGWKLVPPARLLNRPGGVCDVLSIAFRAPTVASGFDHGRFTQPIDGGGPLLLWFSRPGEDLLALAQADRRAWINGTDITWELAGMPGSPQDRYQFGPGEAYCLNAAFVSPDLILAGTVTPANPHGGEFALTATQQS